MEVEVHFGASVRGRRQDASRRLSCRLLRHTPSSQDGIPADLEADLRAFGAQLIQEAGTLAQL
jgi:hypothetical protein